MKNSVVGFNTIFEQVEERTSKLEDRLIEITHGGEKKEEGGMEKKGSIGHHQTHKHTHQGSPKREKIKKGTEGIFEVIIAPNSPNLNMNLDI